MRFQNSVLMNAVTSASSTPSGTKFGSGVIDASELFNASAVAVFSDASAAGTLSMQGSNDVPLGGNQTYFTPTTWVTVPGATASVASGAITVINPTQGALCFRWLRVLWAKSGGAGTVTVTILTQGM